MLALQAGQWNRSQSLGYISRSATGFLSSCHFPTLPLVFIRHVKIRKWNIHYRAYFIVTLLSTATTYTVTVMHMWKRDILVLGNISVWLDPLGLLHSKQLIRSIVSKLVRKATDIKNGRFLACRQTEVNVNSEDLSSGHPLTRISPLIISSQYKTGARNKEQLTWFNEFIA